MRFFLTLSFRHAHAFELKERKEHYFFPFVQNIRINDSTGLPVRGSEDFEIRGKILAPPFNKYCKWVSPFNN